ncbi:viroplasmin family protein [Miniphocaeibacter halophilus]|uniref:Ribonuclease H family protein n=1 Tax=Miniphocaeibacter halophilus TaxID=2931922 RepID=A0AC61MS16_9FIRM|nr:ribonuclease H family protein [Miniphocaeibacter halophilus]QQK07380.1 ribonuclease H family protein [Miniphocaeibacter halophilus]
MAKKYYYAVKKGKTPGIYFNWDDCKKQVIGFKGAIYKKFENIEDAKGFILEEKEVSPKEITENIISEDEAIAFVDGSYNVKSKECGFGAVLFTKKGKETFFQVVENKNYSEYRNVTGEVFGSLYVINKAIEYGLKKIFVHYDYTGISNWALGNWKTNNELTKYYKNQFDILKNEIEVVFVKVKAHSGDKYNEEADKLAKKAVGLL